jgi:imidazolonepropionase-like amidohydrolase
MLHRPLLLSVALLVACAPEPPPAAPPPPPAPPPPAETAGAAPPPAAPVTVRRTTFCGGKLPCGFTSVTRAPDGSLTLALDIHENGRGPASQASVKLAPDHTILSLEAHGHQEMGTTLDEAFTLEGGHARWKSTNEQGEKEINGPAFFLPMSSLPLETLLLRVLLEAPDHTVALLPGGEAHLERAGETTVTAGGASKHLVAYVLTRVDVERRILWAEDDGTYFGLAEPSWAELPDDWTSVQDALRERGQAIRRTMDEEAHRRLAHRPPAAGLALVHARVLDVERGAWIPDQTLIVVGDTIKSVGPSKSAKVPAGVETVDLAGKALLPGLWDMHAHLFTDVEGPLYIAAGVTSVRDVGNLPEVLDDYKKRYDEGAAIGPHVYRAGFIEGTGKDSNSLGVKVHTVDEAKAAVEFYAKRGYDMIKIYNSVPVDLVPVLAKEAHGRGMGVTGHVPVHMLANEAVRAGYDGIEHINQIMLNFFADHDTDTRTTKRFSLVGEKAADLDLGSKPVKDFLALLREHKTVLDPTYDAMEPLLMARQGEVMPSVRWIHDRLPAQTRRQMTVGGLPVDATTGARYRKSWEKLVAMVKVFHDAHVTLVAGTDEMGGLWLDYELEIFVRGGLSTADALRAATIVPARVMKADKRSGSIAAGKVADLVVIDGDPLARITDLRRTVTTYHAGVAFPSRELFRTAGVAPAP